jgi:fluoride exporter
MLKYLLIGIGGFAGANLRYLIQTWIAERWGASFPYGTLFINVTGSFILGFFIMLVTDRVVASPNWRFLIAVGLLGGYTTFSSFTVETLNLAQAGRWLPAGLYLAGNVVLGLVFAFLGMVLARAL